MTLIEFVNNQAPYINANNLNHNFNEFKPYVLYNNTSGSNGDITLSDSVANYSYIEIVYRDDQNIYETKRLYSINLAWYYLEVTQYTATQVITRGKNIQLNGTSIINGQYEALVQESSGNTLYYNNNIYIVKVIGYK